MPVIHCFPKTLRRAALCRVVSPRSQCFEGFSLWLDDNGVGLLLIQL